MPTEALTHVLSNAHTTSTAIRSISNRTYTLDARLNRARKHFHDSKVRLQRVAAPRVSRCLVVPVLTILGAGLQMFATVTFSFANDLMRSLGRDLPPTPSLRAQAQFEALGRHLLRPQRSLPIRQGWLGKHGGTARKYAVISDGMLSLYPSVQVCMLCISTLRPRCRAILCHGCANQPS